MRRGDLVSLSVAAVVIASCTGGAGAIGPGATSGTGNTPPAQVATQAPQPTSQGAAGTAPATVDVCALVSVGDVQGISPFTTPLADSTRPGGPGSCYYTMAIGAPATATVTLTVSSYPTHERAMASIQSTEDTFADRGYQGEPLAGIGDRAEGWPGQEDEVAIEAVQGQYDILAHFKGEWEEGTVPTVDPEAKVQAGAKLLKLVIERLP